MVGWILWHINLCRLFNAKSIFMWIISSISNNSARHGYTVCQKPFFFKLFSLFKQIYITIQFSVSKVSMSKTVQFQAIHFSIITLLKCKYILCKTFLFQAIQFSQAVLILLSISTDFVYTQLNVKIVLYITIQFSVYTIMMSKNSSISNKHSRYHKYAVSSILPIDRACGPMLVTEPNVVWLLVTVLVVAVVFVTTTFLSDCLLLSSSTVSTLCLKDQQREVDAIQPDLLLMVR